MQVVLNVASYTDILAAFFMIIIYRKCFAAYDRFEKTRIEFENALKNASVKFPQIVSCGRKRALEDDHDSTARVVRRRISRAQIPSQESSSPPVLVKS